MKNYQSIHQVLFLSPIFPVSCYLVEEEDGLTLVDAALPFSAQKILQSAEEIGKPIVRIVITHAHEDHLGALDNLKETLPEVPVFISRRDARLLDGDFWTDESEPDTPISGGFLKKLRTKPDILLEDGDKVGSLLAVSTPGHTPGSMSFIDIRTNALIAGDAFQTHGGVAVSGQLKALFPFPAFATWNKQLAFDSGRKLLSFQPSLLACGHGRMIENPVPEMERAITLASKKRNILKKQRQVR